MNEKKRLCSKCDCWDRPDKPDENVGVPKVAWKFNISFTSKSELHKQEVEKWLDDLFSPTSMRRTITGEKDNNVVITYEDTGVRH